MPLHRACLAYVLTLLALNLHFDNSVSETISARYQVSPEVGLKSLSCLSQHVQYNRAVRVDNTTFSICEMMDETWNRNPVFESGFIYMQMLSFQKPFSEIKDVAIYIPEDFNVGNGINILVKTEGVPSNSFYVKVHDFKANTTFMQVKFIPSDSLTALTSELNEEVTREILAPLPTFAANTVYSISVYLQVWQWEVFIDGVPFKNYTHVHPFIRTGEQKVRFKGNDVMCRSIYFIIPN